MIRHILSRRALLAAGSVVPCLQGASPPTSGDSTAQLQAAIDTLPAKGVLDGNGQEHVVTRLNLKSGMTLQNFRFRAKGTAKPLDAVVTIDGNDQPATDIVIRNVHIDGNRAAQTNLRSAEDGGRDGFRIVGRAERIYIADSSAVNCATDGLKIFSDRSLSHDDRVLNFRDIFISNSRFLNNRRHGASGDSLNNVFFIDCEFSGNGVDVAGTAEGCRGALDNGALYGSGVDIEGYGVGSGVRGLFFLRSKAYRNARFGFQFWEPTSPSARHFVPRSNIVFESCSIDGGASPRHGHQALEMSQPQSVRSESAPTYSDVTIVNLECYGTVILNGVQNVTLSGGHIHSPYVGFWGIARECRNIRAIGVDGAGKVLSTMPYS